MSSTRGAGDKGRLLAVRTHTYLSMGDMTGAVACGRQAVQLFGLDLPEQADQVRTKLQSEVGGIIGWSAQHEIESLLDLPVMTDPDRTALMSLLMHMIPPAYQVNPELFALICCHMVRLSIEHGNCPMSAKGYGSFAPILSGIVGNFRDGDRFGKLGVDLCERLNDITVRSACHFTWAAFASAWVRPIQESIKVFREGVRWGLMSGDHPHAAYCSSINITHVMFSGAPLNAVRNETDESLKLLQRVGDLTSLALLRTRYRFTEWLASDSHGPTLDDANFDEARVLRELQATSVSKSMLAHFQSLRLQNRYLAGQFADAWRISKVLDGLLVYVPGMMTVVEHAFFQCLSITGAWNQIPATERAEMEARLEAQVKTIGTWAASCAENFAPLHFTVSAERARVLGETAAADEMYDRAAQAARASRFPHFEAIACELAMHHWQPRDPARARTLRERAIDAYDAWGAVRKVNALRH